MADLVALRAAHAAAREDDLDTVCAADRQLIAVTLAAEFRESARKSGERLISLQRDVHGTALLDRFAERIADGEASGTYPVVLGVVTEVADIDEHVACLLCCHGFVTGLLGAAQQFALARAYRRPADPRYLATGDD